jgi:RNA polymerase sporulation-specific sigma factor
MEYSDNRLIDLVSENDEDARDYLYEKYKYIVDIVITKYKKSAYYLSIDMDELRQEALVGFSDALVSYNQDSNSSLPTFIALCIERRLIYYIRLNDTHKMKMLREMKSLDMQVYEEATLGELLGDSSSDPSRTIEDKENYERLIKKIKTVLSSSEFEIYELLINDYSYEYIAEITGKTQKAVYNAVCRIRSKIKDIIK